MFQVISGFSPKSVGVGGVPVAPAVIGSNLYAFDAANGDLAVVDLTGFTLSATYY